ncbi:hypothetical protein CAEBREN_05429 [Caenorhabditis brenneri]|uniref:Uncharacterized protein n=1 Tax=Caenorhabditis brenneri TaxID=135651 RepID=G0P3S4_CAEBE|nr:hypothetical protein CAEBREN_05429 [Caenorhabditis brenneri]
MFSTNFAEASKPGMGLFIPDKNVKKVTFGFPGVVYDRDNMYSPPGSRFEYLTEATVFDGCWPDGEIVGVEAIEEV